MSTPLDGAAMSTPAPSGAGAYRRLPQAPDGFGYFRSETGQWWCVAPSYGHHQLAGWIWWSHGVTA